MGSNHLLCQLHGARTNRSIDLICTKSMGEGALGKLALGLEQANTCRPTRVVGEGR